MNRWNLSPALEAEVRARDRCCIYCGVAFEPRSEARGARPSWEHIVNDARIVNRRNIALCCRSCNSSKGAKALAVWLDSAYCRRRDITRDSVSAVVKRALLDPPSFDAR